MNKNNGTPPWLDRASHHHWLEAESLQLLDFYRASRRKEGGFGALDAQGRLPADAPADSMITCRMVHCYAIASLRGVPGARDLAGHGCDALLDLLQDDVHGGWYDRWPLAAADDARNDFKAAYIHAFVLLAASSAVVAGIARAPVLLAAVVEVIEHRFWSATEGAMHECFVRDWQNEEAYRGANSNMHSVEAFLQMADVSGDNLWRKRALQISERLIRFHAAAAGHLVVEHFDADWQPLHDYNIDDPADGFRPYGLTPGHAFEWSRLLLQLEAGLNAAGEQAPGWLHESAIALFDSGQRYGWHVDGRVGMVYTVDWDKQPYVRQRRHWTVAEASAAAAALYRRTGDRSYAHWYEVFWDYLASFAIDREHGSWWQELDADNRPLTGDLSAKPDLYHAYQATLLPRLPLAPGMVCAVANALPAVGS